MKSRLASLALLVFVLASAPGADAQSIERSVVGSYGMVSDSGPVRMDAILGELSTATVSGGTITLTQGFHQMPVIDMACLGDFDNSGHINVADLLIFFGSFGCEANCGITDLDDSGAVTVADLLFFFGVYGSTCP